MTPPTIQEITQRLREATGLVRMQGPVTWAQQQLIEKMPDPLVQEFVTVVKGLDVGKRDWEKVIKMMAEKK